MMKCEIGSEYWTGSTPLNGGGVKELLPVGMDARFTLCGRTALELVLQDALRQRTVLRSYLPSYCCHTMIEPFVSKGIAVEFYDVYFTDTGIGCDFREDNECDLVFLMDYFGFTDPKTMQTAAEQKARGKLVVYDTTHAMFCEGMDYSPCDYVFGSFRKWFGVNAGFCAKAGAWIDFPALIRNDWYTELRNDAFDRKQDYMAGKQVEKNVFLQAFSSAEERLETDYVGYGPDDASLQILNTVNVAYIRQKRRENAAYVIDTINHTELHHVVSPYKAVSEGDCPLFVPLRVDPSVRTALRGTLIRNQVYLPIHWPLSPLHRTHDLTKEIYDTELSFVCDQRYGMDNMARAVHVIRSFDNA